MRNRVKLDERQVAPTPIPSQILPRKIATAAPPAVEDHSASRERRPLESYFQEIGGTRTLKREEEVVLAKELEAATASPAHLPLLDPRLRPLRGRSLGRPARALAHGRQALRVDRRRGDGRDRGARREGRGPAAPRAAAPRCARHAEGAARGSAHARGSRDRARDARARSSRSPCSPSCASRRGEWCASCASAAAARSACATSRTGRA